ncbi:putative xyloglucan endotransglucosylase/hydrolase protein 27 [Sesamum alatum]|uniref:Xyloglucan endotransglucosylase/hydrolase n=1 Tax=Sesamum alatum TaxID=300844 RepID=A0AAE1XPR7_9LAMI|nr:putative xyloglucan endotransglucosylase/hydrolase protein 27 [Sesamum alatum]
MGSCPLSDFLFLCTPSIFFLVSFAQNYPSKLVTLPFPFHEAFNPLYGEGNIVTYDGNNSVQISMDETTSSGFHSKLMYVHGYFQTSLKLPENYTAGVVVTFYACNNHKYPFHRDEIDFEFLGHIHGQKWLLQTNFYGNGSTNRGREERYELWFDPSEDFHHYGILWTENRITYYVDNVPIRNVKRVDEMGGDFPSKEMSLYGTIWNGSNWATWGGRYKMDLNYGPFVAKYSRFVLNGCSFHPAQCNEYLRVPKDLTRAERAQMQAFRRKLMTYSYCYDSKRYAVPLPECVFDSVEFQHLRKFDPWTFGEMNGSSQ